MDWITKTDAEIRDIATPIMDGLMEASTDRDFKRHIENFSDRIKANFAEDDFHKQCADYQSKFGTFTDREYVAVTRVGSVANIYWKQRLSKTSDEFLAVLSLSEKNGRYVVERAFVDLWQPQS